MSEKPGRLDEIDSDVEIEVGENLKAQACEDATPQTAVHYDPYKQISMMKYVETHLRGQNTWPVTTRPKANATSISEVHYVVSTDVNDRSEAFSEGQPVMGSDKEVLERRRIGDWFPLAASIEGLNSKDYPGQRRTFAIRAVSISIRLQYEGVRPPVSFQMIQCAESEDAAQSQAIKDAHFGPIMGNLMTRTDPKFGIVTAMDPRGFLIDYEMPGDTWEFTVGKCFLPVVMGSFRPFWRLIRTPFAAAQGSTLKAFVCVKTTTDVDPPVPRLLETVREKNGKTTIKMSDKTPVSVGFPYMGMHWPINIGYRMDSPIFRWAIPPWRHTIDTQTRTYWYDGVSDDAPLPEPITASLLKTLTAPKRARSAPAKKKAAKKK